MKFCKKEYNYKIIDNSSKGNDKGAFRMTENNRFWILNTVTEYTGIIDKDKLLTFNEVVDLLNELHDENQLLHKINEDTIDFMYDNFDSNRIFTNRELNDICIEMGWELSEKGIKIKQLEKENEQLKQHNTELINKIDFLERVIDGDV